MKIQKCFIVVLMVGFLSLTPLLSIEQTTKAQDENPLKIEKVIGLSTTPGTFRKPTGIAVAKDGTIFIADSGESQIEVFDTELKYLYSFGSIGSGDGQFQSIQQIRFDKNDNLYVLDGFLCQMQVFSKDGKFLKKWGDPSQLYSPDDFIFLNNEQIAMINSDHIYTENAYIKVFSLDGRFIRDFIQDPEFINPDYNQVFFDIAVDPKGYVYLQKFGSGSKNDYYKFTQDGFFVCEYYQEDDLKQCAFIEYKVFSGEYMYANVCNAIYQYKIPDDPVEPLQFVEVFLSKIEYDKDKPCNPYVSGLFCTQDKLYVIDYDHNRITIYNLKKQRIGVIQSPIYEVASCYHNETLPTNIFSYPEGLTIGPDRNLYIVNKLYNKVSVLNQNGEEIRSINLPFFQSKKCFGTILLPRDIVFDQQGYCYVSEIRTHSIYIYKPDLTPHMVLEVPDGWLEGLTVDFHGNLMVCVDTDPDQIGCKILLYDISNIHNKEITRKKTILLQNYFFGVEGDIIIDEKENMIVNVAWGIIDDYFQHSNKLLWINPDGEIFREYEFDYPPRGVSRDVSGNIYTIQQGISIVKLSPNGEFIWQQDMGHCGLYNMTIDTNGKIYVTDRYHNGVLVVNDNTLNKTPHNSSISPIPKEVYDFSILTQREIKLRTIRAITSFVAPTQRIILTYPKWKNKLIFSTGDRYRD